MEAVRSFRVRSVGALLPACYAAILASPSHNPPVYIGENGLLVPEGQAYGGSLTRDRHSVPSILIARQRLQSSREIANDLIEVERWNLDPAARADRVAETEVVEADDWKSIRQCLDDDGRGRIIETRLNQAVAAGHHRKNLGTRHSAGECAAVGDPEACGKNHPTLAHAAITDGD